MTRRISMLGRRVGLMSKNVVMGAGFGNMRKGGLSGVARAGHFARSIQAEPASIITGSGMLALSNLNSIKVPRFLNAKKQNLNRIRLTL